MLIGAAVAAAAGLAGVATADVVSAEEFLARRVCITDTVRFTAANGCVSCVDPEHAFVYSAHIASRDGHGENPHVLALARVPVGKDAVALKLELADGMIRCFAGPSADKLTRIPGEWPWNFIADGPGFLGPGIGTVGLGCDFLR